MYCSHGIAFLKFPGDLDSNICHALVIFSHRSLKRESTALPPVRQALISLCGKPERPLSPLTFCRAQSHTGHQDHQEESHALHACLIRWLSQHHREGCKIRKCS